MLDENLKPDFQRQGISKSSGKLSPPFLEGKGRNRFDMRKEKKGGRNDGAEQMTVVQEAPETLLTSSSAHSVGWD